ncbi:hypothetical protein N0V82_008451 [Gnomoniopsis sp. IMI 355080]|nr:hypothetical protein N0V82_008451 [Gnomoniopsis sp. IMI 355080]
MLGIRAVIYGDRLLFWEVRRCRLWQNRLRVQIFGLEAFDKTVLTSLLYCPFGLRSCKTEIMLLETHDSLSEDSLVKAVRSLDQDSTESVPDTLSNLWTLLTNSISGPFHASEELVLRWLLKNMNGNAEAAEKFRRYPMAWRIMTCVFKRIPLISLAKSLDHRRFVSILQQTLQDISKPQDRISPREHASSDVDMAGTRSTTIEKTSKKRKRSAGVSFDLETLRSSHSSLKAAESLFCALQTLIARLESIEATAPSHVLMGAEHVKSLFCSPAKEAVELLRPILSICDLALQAQEQEPFEDQAAWVAVFTSLWALHLQSSADAAEVAMSLYPTGCIVLAKMDRSKDITLDPHVKAVWTRVLRRFFIKNMILPARAAFLNHKDIGIIQTAVDMTNFMPTASHPVLFSLAINTSHSADDASAKKDHEDWTQKVFDTIEEPMRETDPLKRNQAMKVALDTAQEIRGSVSLPSLRVVCRKYTEPSGKMDLGLVKRIARLDVDAFLISDEGHKLLDETIQQVTDLSNTELRDSADIGAVDLIISFAKGFARGRDLSGFIKKWFEALAACLNKGADYTEIAGIWSSEPVVGTVSGLLQSSVNTRQLASLLNWLLDQSNAADAGALLVVLHAISQGITEEEYIDAANIRIYEMISQLELKALNDPTKAHWWYIVESIICRSTLDQVNDVWTKVEPTLRKTLRKGDPNELATSAAFHCCSRFWLLSQPGGTHESEAAALTCSFFKRLEKHQRHASAEDGRGGLKFFESPRLIDLLVRSHSGKEHLDTILARIGSSDIKSPQIRNLVYNEANLNNHKYISGLIAHAIDIFEEQSQIPACDTERITTAAQILLDIPSEGLTREHREQIMPKALLFTSRLQKSTDVVLMKTLLSLMAKIMRRATFYESMKFADLVTVGDSILSSTQASIGENSVYLDLSATYGLLKLFESLATSTMKQMTSNLETRERVYLTEAATIVASWPSTTTQLQPHRPILLRALIIALEAPKIQKQVQEVVDSAALREHASLVCSRVLNIDKMLPVEANWLEGGLPTWCTLIVQDQLDVVDPDTIRNCIGASRNALVQFCEMLCEKGLRGGWRTRELIFRCFGDSVKDPLDISAPCALHNSESENSVALCVRADASDINRYVDIVLRDMDKELRDSYFREIAAKLRGAGDITGHLLTLNRLVCAENGMSHPVIGSLPGINVCLDLDLRSCVETADLAEVHSVLANQLIGSQFSPEFVFIAQTMHTLLDKKAGTMKQWNTEVTLSTVATISAGGPRIAQDVQASPKTFDWLCRLVKVIIKRHRLRLEGHFHLLITALQSLLRLLLVSSTAPSTLKKRAKLFSRLLTLVCEPSVASVTRGQQPGTLDSAVDAAKRSAGQHMYLVLMSYIKLQLERPISRAVREALEPGVFAVLDITNEQGRRILNEAVDGSGRAIFKDMYRRYVKFGKWSGV